jgi:Ca2+-binding RTX toxin-like protein
MKPTAMAFVAVAALMVVLWAGVVVSRISVTDSAEQIKGTDATKHIEGTDSGEQITGTRHSEEIHGLGGDDEITDGLGKDVVYGDEGADNLIGYGGDTSVDLFYGGAGDDTVQSRDVPASKDRVSCGPGTDIVYADKADVVSSDCERVRAW